jgi:hypothetical protein
MDYAAGSVTPFNLDFGKLAIYNSDLHISMKHLKIQTDRRPQPWIGRGLFTETALKQAQTQRCSRPLEG